MSALNSTILYSITGKENQFVAAAACVVAILAATVVYYVLSPRDNEHEFPMLQGIQLYHAWKFFGRRYDFLSSNFDKNPGRGFSFNVLGHKVIALTGEGARHAFFHSPHFNFSEGYKIIRGVVKDADIAAKKEDGDPGVFNKTLNKFLNKPRLENALPTLVRGIIGRADKWGADGKSGMIDPFTEIYDLVFLTTSRLFTCHELAKNEGDLRRIGEILMTLEKSFTPASLLLPWFLSPAKIASGKAAVEFYLMLRNYVEARRKADLTSDAIDILIADGATTPTIVKFVMGVFFVGIVNPGLISCWVLINLAIYPQWIEECKEEIQIMFSRHLNSSVSSGSLSEKFAAIPMSAWEDELPTLDACIRESQRIVSNGLFLRKNLSEGEIKIDGQVVRRGDFLVYLLRETHLNPRYYPEPDKYDPGRWLQSDPVSSATHPFFGWGAGRHPCPGTRVAKLQMKQILAMFLTRYEYELVDENGRFPNSLPVPDRNDHQSRPLGQKYYFSFKKVME